MDITPVTQLARYDLIGVAIAALILAGGAIYCLYKFVCNHASHNFELLTELKEVIKNNTSTLKDIKEEIKSKRK